MHRRDDVVAAALRVLDRYGLADLSMRRLAAELSVRPSALYHHVPDKQTLLGLVADELLRRGRPSPPGRDAPWRDRVQTACAALRDAMLAYRDGAELVATVSAFGLGARAPYDELVGALRDAGLAEALVPTAARTLLHFTYGHTLEEQTHLQAGSAGAIGDGPREGSDFAAGLGLVVDGIGLRLDEAVAARGA